MSKVSKSKTFQKETDFSELYEWFMSQVETIDREVIQITPPDYDVRTELKHKYIVTVTTIDNGTN